MNARMDKARFDAYVREHGRLPPLDHPTLGETSDYMRGDRPINPLGMLLALLAACIILAALGATVVSHWDRLQALLQ